MYHGLNYNRTHDMNKYEKRVDGKAKLKVAKRY